MAQGAECRQACFGKIFTLIVPVALKEVQGHQNLCRQGSVLQSKSCGDLEKRFTVTKIESSLLPTPKFGLSLLIGSRDRVWTSIFCLRSLDREQTTGYANADADNKKQYVPKACGGILTIFQGIIRFNHYSPTLQQIPILIHGMQIWK